MSLTQTAEAFHSAGYNVLIYDGRNVGGSGGSPRNEIDPWQYAQDLSGMNSGLSKGWWTQCPRPDGMMMQYR